MTDTTSSPSNLLGDRISFYGCLIAILAYGAMFMLYIQLAGVLLARTRRGFCYWGAVVYSTSTFPLATLAIAAIFKFSELAFVENRMFPAGPYQYYLHHSCDYVNVLGEISAAIFACFADAIMLFRLWIIWDSSWVVLAFPVLLYCGKLAVTIPVLVAIAKPPPGLSWSLHMSMARLVLSVAFNIYATFMIGLRLRMLRPRMEAVLGKLHAFYYTSVITIFVESAALYTIWDIVLLIMRIKGSLIQLVFFFPAPFIQGVSRLCIILRISQERAWCRELVEAIRRGVASDWQISSTHSIPLCNNPSMSDFSQSSRTRKLDGSL